MPISGQPDRPEQLPQRPGSSRAGRPMGQPAPVTWALDRQSCAV